MAEDLPQDVTLLLEAFRVRDERAEHGLFEVTYHDLRRSFVGDLLDAGADVSMVKNSRGTARSRPRSGTTAGRERTPGRFDRRGELD